MRKRTDAVVCKLNAAWLKVAPESVAAEYDRLFPEGDGDVDGDGDGDGTDDDGDGGPTMSTTTITGNTSSSLAQRRDRARRSLSCPRPGQGTVYGALYCCAAVFFLLRGLLGVAAGMLCAECSVRLVCGDRADWRQSPFRAAWSVLRELPMCLVCLCLCSLPVGSRVCLSVCADGMSDDGGLSVVAGVAPWCVICMCIYDI